MLHIITPCTSGDGDCYEQSLRTPLIFRQTQKGPYKGQLPLPCILTDNEIKQVITHRIQRFLFLCDFPSNTKMLFSYLSSILLSKKKWTANLLFCMPGRLPFNWTFGFGFVKVELAFDFWTQTISLVILAWESPFSCPCTPQLPFSHSLVWRF